MPTVSSPRILFVATSGGEGGIERYSVRLATLLRARGVSVIYACRPGGFLESLCAAHDIPTVKWEVRNSGDLRASFALSRILHDQKINVVHVHSRRDYVPAILGAALAKPYPKVLLHAHLIRRLGEPPQLAGKFFRWGTNGVIAVSEAVRGRLQQEHDFAPGFVHLIPNGVDVDAYTPADGAEGLTRRAAQRQAWGVPDGALVVGMMGRLNAKGQEALLSVSPEIARKHPNVCFVLVGPDGAVGDRERLRAQSSVLPGQVILPGMTEDVPAAMAGFDLLAHLPSDESFGLALAEAMAAGLPTVATDIGGCREVVQDGVTGLLVPLDDSQPLTEALEFFLDSQAGPERRARFGAAGRARILADFSLDRQADRLQELYQEVMA